MQKTIYFATSVTTQTRSAATAAVPACSAEPEETTKEDDSSLSLVWS